MPCFNPQEGWASRTLSENGKRGIVFNRNEGYADVPMLVPCGVCLGCRLERSRQWAVRMMHEVQLADQKGKLETGTLEGYPSQFLTLTYNDKYLPTDASLCKRDVQLFMKRYRKYVEDKFNRKIRYFLCGEYGENDPKNARHREQYKDSALGRPHYHLIVFGHSFGDLELCGRSQSKTKDPLYHSPELMSQSENLWPYGFNTVGQVTFNSAAYVSRYVTKKIGGKKAEEHYKRIDEYGNQAELVPEFTTMSRGGKNGKGLGYEWFEQYWKDIYPKDYFMIGKYKHRPPQYYDRLLEEKDPEMYRRVRIQRRQAQADNIEEGTYERRIQKFKYKQAQFKMLHRKLDK